MKKFRCELWYNTITEHEVERETELSVFVNGKRFAKSSESDQWFNTKEEGKKFMIDRHKEKINNLKSQIKFVENKIKQVKEIQ